MIQLGIVLKMNMFEHVLHLRRLEGIQTVNGLWTRIQDARVYMRHIGVTRKTVNIVKKHQVLMIFHYLKGKPRIGRKNRELVVLK